MRPLPRRLTLLALLLWLVACLPLLADSPPDQKKKEAKKPAASKFMRIQRDAKNQPTALETATVRYVPASGENDLVVDLIGVVHVGEKAYYRKLSKQFEQYDVLLYELVAPQGTRVPRGGKQSGNPVGMLQQLMKSVLDLDSQVEQIDYHKKNFVHADLSPDEMLKAMRERGEDPLTVFLSVMADMMRQANVAARDAEKKKQDDEEPELDIFALLTDPHAAVKLKRMMATQFENEDALSGGLGGTLGTILITDRNKAALKVLEAEIAKGKKKIGIFYGAAHMPDFEQRLKADFGLKRDSEQWLTAWDLKMEGKGKGGLPLNVRGSLETVPALCHDWRSSASRLRAAGNAAGPIHRTPF